MLTRKEKILLPIGITALTLSFVVVGFSSANLSHFKKSSGLDHYTLTLDANNAPSALTSSYQDSVTGTYTTADGNSITMNFVKAKSASGKHVDLASRGMIYNFASESGGISGITAITVSYTGSTMGLRTSVANALSNGTAVENSYSLTSGTRLELPSPRYFSILAADGGNVITSISIEYSCGLNDNVNRLNGEYTGTGDNYYRYSLTLNNGAVTLHSLDNPTEITATGTATLSGNSLQCSFTSPSAYNGLVYNFTADAQSHSLTYVSKSGTGNANVPQVSLYRVYNVEDFESYSSSGNGWDTYSNATKYTATGLKGDWVCEYANNNSSTGPIGGQGWSKMGSEDYLKYSSNKGHNGSKALALKGNSNTMRFFQASGYYGVPRVIGKGNKLSFWTKGAFTNSDLGTASSLCANVTVFAFYTQQVNSSTFNSRTEKEFVIANSNDWQEYTMDLDPNKTYYSIGFLTRNHDGTAKYLSLDDFKIYTSCPYGADLSETLAGNFKGYGLASNKQHLIILSLGSHGKSYIELAGDNHTTSGTYTFTNNEVKITTNVRKIGTFTGTYDIATNTIKNCSFSGTISGDLNNNGSITLNSIEHSWTCDEESTELREIFRRRYQASGTWQFDNDNDDRIVSINYQSISNGRALRRRGYSSGPVSIVLRNDFSGGITASNLIFWIYNPTNSAIAFRTWVYRGTSLSSGSEVDGEVKNAAANSWTFVQIGFEKGTVYNFQIADFTNSGVALSYDNIAIY